MQITQEIILYSLLGLGVMVVGLFISTIILFSKCNKQKKRYDFFMGTNRKPEYNLEMKLEEFYRSSQEIEKKYDSLLNMVTDLDKIMENNVQKIGLIRYNPFDEMGGNLCFALAMLDGKDNGVVINGIHSRTGSFTYAKPIELGVSIYMLSEEEIRAVEMAKENTYKVKHEKVVKVKFKQVFKRVDKNILKDKMALKTAKISKENDTKPKESIGDVTFAEKELILEDEKKAMEISVAESYVLKAIAQEELVQEIGVKIGPTKIGPTKIEPMKIEPMKIEPMKIEPVCTEFIFVEKEWESKDDSVDL